MIAISTYSGECDGLGYAAELAGIDVAAYCEVNLKRRLKLAEKHPGKPIFKIDEELTADAIHALGIYPDLLFGGPPCQPYSCAGAQRGVSDPRHRWPEMLRFIRECRPRWVVVENVGNFVNMALDIVWSDLEAEDYEVGAIVLPALAVGAPHRRDRCFVVANTQCSEWREDIASCGRVERSNAIPQQPESASRLEQCGEDGMADTEGKRRGEAREHCTRSEERLACSGESLGDTESLGSEQGCMPRGNQTKQSKPFCGSSNKHGRPAEPRLGRGTDGLPDRLHEVMSGVSADLDKQMSCWPAWRGQEQYSWEPPRTVWGMSERARRIELLGLAVVPWQAYPIFALINELHDEETKNVEYWYEKVEE